MPLFSYKFCMVFKFNSAKAVSYAYNYLKNGNPFYMCGYENEDCNFISQCLLAGSEGMTSKSCDEWFYENEKNFSESWVDRERLFIFLLNKATCGPFSRLVNLQNLSVGDIVFFMQGDVKVEVGLITRIDNDDVYYVSRKDVFEEKVLLDERKEDVCFVHILGVKK